MDLKEKLVDFFINIVGLSELDANIYADVFIESGISDSHVKHGEWKKTRSHGTYECSCCGNLDTDCDDYYGTHCVTEQKYCPECGAEMKKEE